MYCVDVIDALTKDFFARKGNPIDETLELTEVQAAVDRPGYDPVSSTLWRQREEYCARLIQNAWRRHKILIQTGLLIRKPATDDPNNAPGPSSVVVQIEEEDEEAVNEEDLKKSSDVKVTFASASTRTSSKSSLIENV